MPNTANFRARRRSLEARVRELRLAVPVMARYAQDKTDRARVQQLAADMDRKFGPMTSRERALAAGAVALAARYALRLRMFGDRYQPATHRQTFRGEPWRIRKAVEHWLGAWLQRTIASRLALPSRSS